MKPPTTKRVLSSSATRQNSNSNSNVVSSSVSGAGLMTNVKQYEMNGGEISANSIMHAAAANGEKMTNGVSRLRRYSMTA